MKLSRVIGVLSLLLATAVLTSCSAIDKLKARDRLNRGVGHYKSQDYIEAEKSFSEAVELDPDLMAARLYLGTTYQTQFVPGSRDMGNLRVANKAIEVFQVVLEMEPDNLNAMANIAYLHFGRNEFDEAKEWQRRILEVDPSNPQPLYGIGNIDFQLVSEQTGLNGENIENMTEEDKVEVVRLTDEGIEALRQAVEIDPDYSEALDTLNLLYRERANLSEEDEEKQQWLLQADKLALQAIEAKKRREREEEEARRRVVETQN